MLLAQNHKQGFIEPFASNPPPPFQVTLWKLFLEEKGKNKTMNKTFRGPKWPVWGLFFGPESPPKKSYVGPQDMRHINFFLAPRDAFWPKKGEGGGCIISPWINGVWRIGDNLFPDSVCWTHGLETHGCKLYWEKLNRGCSKPGGFPLFSGKVRIVSRTLLGLFLVGAVHRPRKRKRTNRENPRRVPEPIGKIGKVPKKDKEGE